MMSNDDAMTTNAANQQFVEGMPVFDAGGEKIGSVSDYDPQGGYLVARKGWLFPEDVYIPLSAVARNDADGVYLTLTKDDILNQDWSRPPAYEAGTTTAGTRRASSVETDTGEVRVPVMEEELVASKQEREMGRAHLHKDVIEEQQTITEPVTREEVHVERVPVQGAYTDVGPDAFTEKDIDVPVMGEELVTGKRAVVTDEVRVYKEPVTEEQQVTETVRKERVTVDGADEVQGADDTRWNDSIHEGRNSR